MAEECPVCELGAAVKVVDNLCAEARVEGIDCDQLWEAFEQCVKGSQSLDESGTCSTKYLDDIVQKFQERGRPDMAASVAEVRSWVGRKPG